VPTQVQPKVVAPVQPELTYHEGQSAFAKKSPIARTQVREYKPMCFEQQSQTELSMYDPSLNDMAQYSSAKKAQSSVSRVLRREVEEVEVEEEEEEQYVQKSRPGRRAVAPKKALPKRQAKVQRKSLREYEEEEEEESFTEEEEDSFSEEEEDDEEEVEVDMQVVNEQRKRKQKVTEEEQLFGDEPAQTKSKAKHSPCLSKNEAVGTKRQRVVNGGKTVRFNVIDSESDHDTPLPEKRRTRNRVNYAALEKEEEPVQEEEVYVPVQKKQKVERVDPEKQKREKEFNQRQQKILNNSKFGSRIQKLLAGSK